ncbi:MAG: prephenate dehydratase [Acidimicrobiia bacterium]|jgi:prephenate dehydratase|nr:prephenate dehydratase [Acidimicrobiia bacterium]
MVVDPGMAEVGKRQPPETGNRLVGRDQAGPYLVEERIQVLFVHLTILPGVTEQARIGPRIGFLGPRGTFHEAALRSQPDLASAELVPFPTIQDVLAATEAGEVDAGFCAIENAIEGTVNVTVDTLTQDVDLLMQREVVLDIRMALMAVPGTRLEDVHTVLSFPHALGQCRRYLRDQLPGASVESSASTAEAARLVGEKRPPGVAAIGPSVAADLYDLEVVAIDIEDHPGNQTRFVAVAREGIPRRTGHDKTSVVVYQKANQPGSLLTILQEFAARSINLSKLESLPTKRGLGDYCFLIDLDGHIEDELVADALRSLKSKQADVKFLGSYPAAGEEAHEARAEAAESWREADQWLEQLRQHIRR